MRSFNRYQLHPWHGINPICADEQQFKAFIEIVPSDTIKYEIDKDSGFLKIDRPQKYSNITPCLYGFIPQTYCGEGVAALSRLDDHKIVLKGDGDPLDICVLCSHHIPNGNILLEAKPIGGFRLIDKGEADDKIIAVLVGDEIFGKMNSINDVEPSIIQRLKHYFLTYKSLPDAPSICVIEEVYDRASALKVIDQSFIDYKAFTESAA